MASGKKGCDNEARAISPTELGNVGSRFTVASSTTN
jgi:hypothetical protein